MNLGLSMKPKETVVRPDFQSLPSRTGLNGRLTNPEGIKEGTRMIARNDKLSWILRANWLLAFLGAMLFICTARASIDIVPLQQRLNQGQALEVRKELDQALSSSPENPHLLYNRAVASYAAGLYEEALLDLDLVESARPRSLANKARFQKGNAEFRLGLNTSTNDLEATISRWKCMGLRRT